MLRPPARKLGSDLSVRLLALAALTLLAFSTLSAARESAGNICDWVLVQSSAQSRLENPVEDFLREHTEQFDISEYGELTEPLDFITESAVVHPDRNGSHNPVDCIRIDGCLSEQGAKTCDGRQNWILRLKNLTYVPVTLFVYDSGIFAENAKSGNETSKTNVRVKVGSLNLGPETSDHGSHAGLNDPLRTFYVSAYLSGQLASTITGSADRSGTKKSEGGHVWFVGDIGKGPQLLAAICETNCRQLHEESFQMPQYLESTEIEGSYASGVLDNRESESERDEVTDFAGESLILRDSISGQEFGFSSLKERTAEMSADERATIASRLDELAGTGISDAVDVLSHLGVIEVDSKDWEFESYQRRHVITMRPARPNHLTAVRLKLSEPADRSILGRCVPMVEITQSHHGTTVHPMNIDLDSRIGSTYSEFEVMFEEDHPVMALPLESLSVRIFIGSGPGDGPTCKLTWNEMFPEDAFDLVGSAANMPSHFSLNRAGEAVFSEAELAHTEPAAYILIFNKTGPVDENGQPVRSELYPDWNSADQHDELVEALTRFMRVAHDAYSDRTRAVFTLTGAGPVEREFGRPTLLTDDRVQNEVVTLLPGSLGIDSLKIKVEELIGSESERPIVLVIGRSGLPLDSNYCESALDILSSAGEGSVLVDFAPHTAESALPVETIDELRSILDTDNGPNSSGYILRRLPAAHCPKSGPNGYDHWVLFPDYKIVGWNRVLGSLARQVFEEPKSP